jgi:hypothetical protein
MFDKSQQAWLMARGSHKKKAAPPAFTSFKKQGR